MEGGREKGGVKNEILVDLKGKNSKEMGCAGN